MVITGLPERVVVTGGDSGYFPLIDELCASVRGHREEASLGLVVIDGGLEAEQKQRLISRWGARILEVGWDFDIPERRIRGREHLKVLTSRTFLDQRLPDAELICWMDGDAWLQDAAALDLLFKGASLGRVAVVSQTSRYSANTISLKWAPFGYAQVRSQLYKNARRAGLGEEVARTVGDKPTFNAGVFALARTAPHWEAWRRRLGEALKRGRVFTSDQLALGIIIHADGLPAELMPETCNYMGPWTCTDDEATLVERYLPNAPVGVVHMAGFDAMRRSLEISTEVRTLDGRALQKSLRRPAWVKA